MIYPPEIIEEVRSLNDIVEVVAFYVELRARGSNHLGLCPFHREKTPSFSVNADKQIFKCFGCGAGGNVFSFIMQIENFDFLEALKHLAERARYTLPQAKDTKGVKIKAKQKELIIEINKKAARYYYDNLQNETMEATRAAAYLYKRGISQKARKVFGIGTSLDAWDALYKHLIELGYTAADISLSGLSSENKTGGHYDRFRGRMIFPILDIAGKVVGFGGRVLDEQEKTAKYINSPETPLFEKSRQLYGLNIAKKTRMKEIVLVEGYMDVISLYQAGFPNTAGSMGTALTPEHARLLKRVNIESVILLYDSDEAGTKAALRAIPLLLDSGFKVRVAQVHDAKDPDEYILKFGEAKFAALLSGAKSHISFRLGLLAKKYPKYETDEKGPYSQEAAELLATLTSEIETDIYMKELASQTGISPHRLDAEINKAREGKGSKTVYIGNKIRLAERNKQGIQSAYNELLQLLFANNGANRALIKSGALSPDIIENEFYKALLEIAFEGAKSGYSLMPADIISRFDTLDEQKMAADVFNRTIIYESDATVEKALNDMMYRIRDDWYVRRMEDAKTDEDYDMGKINELLEARQNLKNQKITIEQP